MAALKATRPSISILSIGRCRGEVARVANRCRSESRSLRRASSSFHFEQRFAPAPRFIEDAFHATEPASNDHLAALVRNLRPEWSRVREQYVEELAILAGQLKGT